MSELAFDELTGALIGPKELGAVLKECAAKTDSPVTEKYIRLFLFQPYLEPILKYASLKDFERLAAVCDGEAFWKRIIRNTEAQDYTSGMMAARSLAFLLTLAKDPSQMRPLVDRARRDDFVNDWNMVSFITEAAEMLGRMPDLDELTQHYITHYGQYLPRVEEINEETVERFAIDDWHIETFVTREHLMEYIAFDLSGRNHYQPFGHIGDYKETTIYPLRYEYAHRDPKRPPWVLYVAFDPFFNRIADFDSSSYDDEEKEQLRKLRMSLAGKSGALRRITKPLEEFSSGDDT